MTINGSEISNWEAVSLNGNIKETLQYPSLKKPIINDWRELDGLEVDLSAPVLDIKTVKLYFKVPFYFSNSFVGFIRSELDMIYSWEAPEHVSHGAKLRFVSAKGIDEELGISTIELSLIEDNSFISSEASYSYSLPTLTAQDQNWEIDNNNFSIYGIYVLKGSKTSLSYAKAIKDRLVHKSNYSAGAVAVDSLDKYKEQQITLNLLIRDTWTNFIGAYKAFLYDLVRPNARSINADGLTFDAYYKSSKIKDFEIVNNMVYCNFEVNLIMI